MRIAIVSGHFMPELGYQEVYLARALARQGHAVKVLASNAISPTATSIVEQEYEPGLTRDEKYGYEILRLKKCFGVGSNVVVRGLKRAVLEQRPDVIIIIALAKLFAAPLLTDEVIKQARVIGVFGDALEYANKSTWWKRCMSYAQSLAFNLFKKRLYRYAVRYCHRLVMNHPEAEAIYLGYLNRHERALFREKAVRLTLGYDREEFYFSQSDRDTLRNELNISSEEVVIITSTRVVPTKKLEHIVDLVSTLISSGMKIKYIIVGFLSNSYGEQLRRFISQQPQPECFFCYPFLSHEEIRRIYCAADVGIWSKAAISIQEAMGTGLPVILEHKQVVSHLITNGVNGWYYAKNDLPKVIRQAATTIGGQDVVARMRQREMIASLNESSLSYDNISRRMLAAT